MQRASTARIAAAGCRLGGLLALVTLAGCGGRNVTIQQDHFINTAMQIDRAAEQQTGEPLELAVVCVYPKDLDKPANDLLRPDLRITCKDWYERRPVVTGEARGCFELPREQIYVLSNDDLVFGRHIGQALRGAAFDGEAPIRKGPLKFRWGDLHNDRAVIYVFGKFGRKDGTVLPVPPAKFHPPGAYSADLVIRIGVDRDRPLEEAQYIRAKARGGE